MDRLLVLTLALYCVAKVTLYLFQRLNKKNQITFDSDIFSLPQNAIKQQIEKYGTESNSFLTLYPGYQYFVSSDPNTEGTIAYVENQTSWIGACNPLCPTAYLPSLLKDFADSAKQNGKSILLLPASENVARVAKKMGYGTLKIGAEPTFDLTQYDPKISVFPKARHMASFGAKVHEFVPNDLPRPQLQGCNEIVENWLNSRPVAPLGFLNRVRPWELSEHKKYFLLEFEGSILAFLAAVPIWPRKGWYFVDLMRHPKAPPGTVELLILESMRQVKEKGALMVSLGVSPFAELNQDSKPLLIQKGLHFIFEHLNFFYRFKPLYQFKTKFRPTHTTPVYLICFPRQLSFWQTLSLIKTIVPGGVPNLTWSYLFRLSQRFFFWKWLEERLSAEVVTRKLPTSWAIQIERSPTTLKLATLAFCFLAWKWGAMLMPPNSTLAVLNGETPVFSTFYTTSAPIGLLLSLFKISLNLGIAGIIECLCGGRLVLRTLAIAVPLALFYQISQITNLQTLHFPTFLESFWQLGTFCLISSFFVFLKWGRVLLCLLCLFLLLFFAWYPSSLALFSLVASLCGYGVAWWMLIY